MTGELFEEMKWAGTVSGWALVSDRYFAGAGEEDDDNRAVMVQNTDET